MGGSASVEDSRTAALPMLACQCGLNISYISIDLSEYFKQRSDLYAIFFGKSRKLLLDVGDGLPGSPTTPVSPQLAKLGTRRVMLGTVNVKIPRTLDR